MKDINLADILILLEGIFLGMIWDRITVPSKFKNEQKLPKMVYIIPNFLGLHVGENFMKIRSKLRKLAKCDNLHKNVNENVFIHIFMQFLMSLYGGQLKQQICYCISNMVFSPFKMAV